MKRMMYAAACIVALMSCQKEQGQPFAQELKADGSEPVLASATDFVNGNELTRTVISQEGTSAPTFAWKEGDVIGVIPMDNETVQSNYKIAQIGSDPKQAVFDGGVWALKKGKEYAAYYPFNEKIARSGDKLAFSFLGQKQSANNSLEHLGAYDYMYASPVVCTNNVVMFQFKHLISLVRLQLTVPSSDTFNTVSLESEESWFASSASLKLSDGTATAVGSQKSCRIDLNDIQVASGNVLTVWFSVLPTASLKNKTLSVKLFGANANMAEDIAIADEWKAGKAYSYAATLSSSGQEVEYVDLGLPSGLKWATCNIGAKSPEEYGDYYAWGEIETKKNYTDDTYKFYKTEIVSEGGFDIEYSGYTKYIPQGEADQYDFRGFYDNKKVLDPEDDVAHVKLGGKWRMPTTAEFDELINNCQCDWVTYKGVKGRKFTSKKTGYTDKWIFLPAAGYRNGGYLSDVGSDGYYWSSSLTTGLPNHACELYFGTGGVRTGYDYRYLGLSVRPVSE